MILMIMILCKFYTVHCDIINKILSTHKGTINAKFGVNNTHYRIISDNLLYYIDLLIVIVQMHSIKIHIQTLLKLIIKSLTKRKMCKSYQLPRLIITTCTNIYSQMKAYIVYFTNEEE